MKVFMDTNILVTAYATHGACNELLNHCISRHRIYTSDFVLEELEEKLLQKIKLTEQETALIISFLRRNCAITTEQKITPTSRDREDDHILAAAIMGRVDCVLTGDKDLLDVKSFQGIPILLPADFWKLEEQKGL